MIDVAEGIQLDRALASLVAREVHRRFERRATTSATGELSPSCFEQQRLTRHGWHVTGTDSSRESALDRAVQLDGRTTIQKTLKWLLNTPWAAQPEYRSSLRQDHLYVATCGELLAELQRQFRLHEDCVGVISVSGLLQRST